MNIRSTAKSATERASTERAGHALILASFLSSAGFTFVFPLLPLYMQELSDSSAAAVFWAGLAMAATPMAGAVVAPFWGRLADRYGYRPMLLRALFSTAVVIGLMALPNAPWQLVVLRVLAGALGSFQPVAMAALTSWSRPEDLARAISRLQMAQVMGAIAGPLLGGIVSAFMGVRYAPLAGAISIAVGVVMVERWFHEPRGRRAQLRGAGTSLSPTMLWLPMLTLIALQFTDASFNPILPLLLAQGGADPPMVAALSGLAASLSSTAAAIGSGLAGRSIGIRVRAMMAMAGGVAVLALAAVAAPVPWGVVAIRILCGGAVSAVAVGCFTAGGLMVPLGQRGSAYGWLSSSGMVGYAASPLVAGGLAAIDLRAVLVVDAVLCLIAAAGWRWSPQLVAAPVAGAVQPAAESTRGSARATDRQDRSGEPS